MSVRHSFALAFLAIITASVDIRPCSGKSPLRYEAGPKSSDEVNKTRIAEKMEGLKTALLTKDSLSLSALLAEDVTYGHTNGLTQSKQELIRSVMSGQQDYKSITIRKSEIRIHGNTAIVNIEGNSSLLLDGKPLDLDMDVLLVWVLEKDGWKLAARQSVRNN
jgi:ketosteroid isomerase-like protein